MRILFPLLIFQLLLLVNANYSAQTFSTTNISNLCPDLHESSGLCFANNEFYTINDSGNSADIYVIDSLTGCWSRKIHVSNEFNIDWESITCDTEFLYIGDFGNNDGTRTNLKILKISLDSLALNNTVIGESIFFSYASQINFSPAPNNTPFDCEAFVSMNDSLYLFSKNWTADTFLIYPISKTPGVYSLAPIDSIPTLGKITDAHYDGENLRLLGYDTLPFCQFYKNLSSINSIENIAPTSYSINFIGSPQMEALCSVNEKIYITSEKIVYGGFTLPSIFGRLSAMDLAILAKSLDPAHVYRVGNQLHVTSKKVIAFVELFDLTGARLSSANQNATSFVLEVSVQHGIAVFRCNDGTVFSKRF